MDKIQNVNHLIKNDQYEKKPTNRNRPKTSENNTVIQLLIKTLNQLL